MREKTKKLIILSLIVFSLFLFYGFASARDLEIDYPEIFGMRPNGLPEYIRYIFSFVILIAGLILLGSLIYGGILYLTSAGQPVKLKEARDQIFSAFTGVIFLLASYIVLYTIDPGLIDLTLPKIIRPGVVEPLKPTPLEPEEVDLIALEIPYGQTFENVFWAKEKRENIQKLLKENEKFLTEEIKVQTSKEETFTRISDLNKYLQNLVEDCRCENLIGLATLPASFGMPISPDSCAGDPCLERARKGMDKILEINREKQKKLLQFRDKILEQKKIFRDGMNKFVDVEEEIFACKDQAKDLSTLNEHLSLLDFFEDRNWKVKTLAVPGTTEKKGDPLTFYCTAGGTILDHHPRPSVPGPAEEEEMFEEMFLEFMLPEIAPEEAFPKRISCPIEFPLGEIVDEARELGSLLIIKMERLATLHEKMASGIEKTNELISQCNDKYCKMNSLCVPNPCYLKCAPLPNPCRPFCKSPCLQAVGGCLGFCGADTLSKIQKKIENCLKENCPVEEMEKLWQEIGECRDACPRPEIGLVVGEIKAIDDEINKTIREIEQIFPRISFLLEDKENPSNLQNIRTGISLCYTPYDIEITNGKEPMWTLLDCHSAIDNFGPDDQIIGGCQPRNFFCCTLEPGIPFPWELFPKPKIKVYPVARQKFEPLAEIGGCPQGWLCNPDVKNYNQYNDASEPLQELLSCMRQELDKAQKEKEIKNTIGRISFISDSKLHREPKTCDWLAGPLVPGGCSHTYEITYGKERISAHYGGRFCRYEKKSYAVGIDDKENADHIKAAAKKCRPDAYFLHKGTHLYISIARAEGCGAN